MAVTATSENYYTKSTKEAAVKKEAESAGRVSHDDFMQLLMAQLANQDPLSPVNDTEFVGQMAQLQALDEQVSTSKSLAALRTESQLQSASAMIGKTVTGTATNGNEATGVVKSVLQKDDGAYLVLENMQQIPVTEVANVADSPAKTTHASIQEASGFIGSYVYGRDANNNAVEGVVIGARKNANGSVTLLLPDGKSIPFENVATVTVAVSADPEDAGDDTSADAGSGSADESTGA